MSFRGKHRGVDDDDAKVRGSSNAIVRRGANLGVQEEGGDVLDIEHLAVELIRLGSTRVSSLTRSWVRIVLAMAIPVFSMPTTKILVCCFIDDGGHSRYLPRAPAPSG